MFPTHTYAQSPSHPTTHSHIHLLSLSARVHPPQRVRKCVSRDLSRSSCRERLRRHTPPASSKGAAAAAAAARATATTIVRVGLCFFQSQTLLSLSGRVKSAVRSLPHDVSQSSGAGATCIADSLPHACDPYNCLRQYIATYTAASKAPER